jgi:hypothetical protein
MDWIETLFGISPDAGTGVTELLFAAAAASVALMLLGRRRRSTPREHLKG